MELYYSFNAAEAELIIDVDIFLLPDGSNKEDKGVLDIILLLLG